MLKPDDALVLLGPIGDAAAARGDVEWARALLATTHDTRLVALLPAGERDEQLVARLSRESLVKTAHELVQAPRPWGPRLSEAVLAAIGREKDAGHAVRVLRDTLPVALPPRRDAEGRATDALGRRRRRLPAYHSARRTPVPVPAPIDQRGLPMSETEIPGAVLRAHAEQQYAAELAALEAADDRPRPPSWRLSPWAVVTYLLGGTLADGTRDHAEVHRLRGGSIEIAVATLATDRALLLLGVPGTAKTWVGEHLAAAISGDSTLLVQGTAGTAEEALRYGWNYARLLAEGPSARRAGAQPGDARRWRPARSSASRS